MGRLRDKVILITGAAGGIGSAIAEAVVRNGGIAIASDESNRAGCLALITSWTTKVV